MTIDSITKALVDGYREGGANIGDLDLPSRQQVSTILREVESIIFPGFSRDEAVNGESVQHFVAQRLHSLKSLIAREARREIKVSGTSHRQPITHENASEEANRFAEEFLEGLPKLRVQVLKDVDALCAGDPAVQSREEVMLAYPGLAATLVYRVANAFWKGGLRLIARIMSELCHSRTGIDIHPAATIGASFYIDHGTGVVIGETTTIGDRVKIYQGVSLGALSVSKKVQGVKRHPTICDDVTIYAGATILGGETLVGHHSVIGGNVWLIKSVPPYSVVENDAAVRIRERASAKSNDSVESESRCLASLHQVENQQR